MTDPTPRPTTPRRRSAEQANGIASALSQSFTAQPPPAAAVPTPPPPAGRGPAVAAPEPSASPTEAPVAVPSATAAAAPAAAAAATIAPATDTRTRPRASSGSPASPEPTRAARGAGERSPRPSTPPSRPASRPAAPGSEVARPPRPSRPRLVEPTPYATKHRDVRSARIQALLRESDLDVLDEVSRLTQDQTGEETNRSELLRALVEALAAAGVTEELAECGTHRARVAFLADRLRS